MICFKTDNTAGISELLDYIAVDPTTFNHLDVKGYNNDERRSHEMLSKQAFLEACADSDVNLNWNYRQVIRDMSNDEWAYFVARLLLGAELLPLLDSFKEKPQLVKVVKD